MLRLLPKPSRFLLLISLKTGCEVVCLFAILNKASGLYGMLALLTGAHVSAWQMSMYVYSLLATGMFLQCMRYIAATGPRSCLASRGVRPISPRSGMANGDGDTGANAGAGGVLATLTAPAAVAHDSLLGVVLFAWLYLVDSVVNGVYTALFATSWFLVLSHDLSSSSASSAGSGGNGTQNGLPGAGMLGQNAGFTNPTYTVPAVVVEATPLPGGGMQAGMAGVPANSTAAAAIAGSGLGYGSGRSGFGALLAPEQLPSKLALAAILLLKSYFVLVAFGYAARCVDFVESASISSSPSGSSGGGGNGGGGALMGGSAGQQSSGSSTDTITAEPYQNAGWRSSLYKALTRGTYWRATDLRLSKARSSGRE